MPCRPAPSKSRSNCTKNDSVSGFFRRRASMACKRNCNDEFICWSFGLVLRYCTKTRAATYTQKDMNGFICSSQSLPTTHRNQDYTYCTKVHMTDHAHNRSSLCRCCYTSDLALITDACRQPVLVCLEDCCLVKTYCRGMDAHIREHDVRISQTGW